MARRIIEEDTTVGATVVEGDGSWVGRTIVALVVIALLTLGAIYLFNNIGDGDGGGVGNETNIENNEGDQEGDTNIEVPGGGGDQPEPAAS